MPGRAEQIFTKLQDLAAIKALISQSEDAYFDCKEWPSKPEDAQKMLAKAACGLTNAEGGVLVIGLRAASRPKDEPDVVEAEIPVSDTTLVKSRVLDLIGNLVEPGIIGIQVAEINEPAGATTGFVVACIPASQGPPRRSRKDWKFYLRIGSGTFPMEYFQIEDRFGQRPHPKLELSLEPDGVRGGHNIRQPARWFVMGLRNNGRAIAKFPSIRYKTDCGLIVRPRGINGMEGFGLQRRPSEVNGRLFEGERTR